MRDYMAMRSVLATVAASPRPVKYGGFYSAVPDEGTLRQELERLGRDGLIDNGIRFQDGGGCCLGGEVSITDEGREFFNLIENYRVWELVRGTLDAAGIDVPLPAAQGGLREDRQELRGELHTGHRAAPIGGDRFKGRFRGGGVQSALVPVRVPEG